MIRKKVIRKFKNYCKENNECLFMKIVKLQEAEENKNELNDKKSSK